MPVEIWKKNPCALLLGIQNAQPLRKTAWQVLKKLNILLPEDTAYLLLIYTQEKRKHMSYKDLHANVHCTFISNWQKLGTTEMFISRLTEEHTAVWKTTQE